jgi:hypothetical protein
MATPHIDSLNMLNGSAQSQSLGSPVGLIMARKVDAYARLCIILDRILTGHRKSKYLILLPIFSTIEPLEGRIAIVTNAGRDAVDADIPNCDLAVLSQPTLTGIGSHCGRYTETVAADSRRLALSCP